MKVYLSNYRNHWLSPYTILDKVIFWREIDYDEPLIKAWHERLLPLCKGAQKFLNFIHPDINYVKIDQWDTWNIDATLAPICLALLKQYQETKHGAPNVDDEDVPEEIRSTSAPPKENEWDTDEFHFKRWDWVVNEMIFAFQHLADNAWEEQFYSGHPDTVFKKTGQLILNPLTGKMEETSELVKGPNDTFQYDFEGHQAVFKRIDNGLLLFGKYFRSLWD